MRGLFSIEVETDEVEKKSAIPGDLLLPTGGHVRICEDVYAWFARRCRGEGAEAGLED